MSWFINDGSFFEKNISILSAKGAAFLCLLMGVSRNQALKNK